MLKDKIQAGLMKCKSLQEMIAMLTAAVGVEPTTATQADTPPDNSEYGLKAHGNKAREEINKQCKEILNAVTESADLTPEQRDVLLQYSGRGGLAEGSQYEYYTPTVIAEGLWDAVKANGFENGNVLDPCCGAGVFCGTKPAGVVMTATDIDETGAGVAGLLNPTDSISNVPFETLAVNTPDNTFDSAIGNVPFGNVRGASAHLDPQYKDVKQLEFYFILRAIDKVKNGGLVAFISSPTAIDNKQKTFVKYRTMVSKKAEFLGAHRLPAGVFHNQGTDTVTDILFFRKHPQDVLEKIENGDYTLETLQAANVVWDEFVKGGKYFKDEGKKFVYGTVTKVKNRFGDMVETVVNGDQNGDGKLDNAALAKKLAIKFKSRIDWDLLNSTEPIVRNYVEGDTRFINGAQYKFENGDWVKVDATSDEAKLDKNLFGVESTAEITNIIEDPLLALDLTPEQLRNIGTLQNLPDCLKAALACTDNSSIDGVKSRLFRASLLGSQIERLAEDERQGYDVSLQRAKLQEKVTAEIQTYGHPKYDKHMQNLTGTGTRQFYLFSTSVDAETGKFKGTLAEKQADETTRETIDTNNAYDVVMSLYLKYDAPVEYADFKNLYTGTDIASVADFIRYGNIAVDGDGELLPMQYFLSGEVVAKMEAVNKALKETKDKDLQDKYKQEIDLLSGKMNHKKIDALSITIHSPWIPRNYIEEWLEQQGNNLYFYDEEHGEWDTHETKLTGYELQFLHYLNGENISGKDAAQISINRGLCDADNRSFAEFIKNHPNKDVLEAQYNKLYNSYVPVEYSTESLGIEDITSGDITPHNYQNQEVRRLTDIGSGVCGFGVGLGKTTTALALTANLYKKGRFKRTALIVPDSVLENWYHESNKFYNPEFFKSNVRVVGIEPVLDKAGNVQTVPVNDENGEQIVRNGKPQTKHVVKRFSDKAHNAKALWDIVDDPKVSLIVMSKELFGAIPLSPENVKDYAGEMVSRSGVNSKKGYKAAKERERLENRFNDEGRTKNRTDYPFMDVDLGIDSVITDESHNYKNCLESAGSKRTGNVKFISKAPVSQVGKDLMMKAEYIRSKNKGKGVFGLSATPVTNSPIEIFNMLSLVMPYSEWQKRQIKNVDDFMDSFVATAEKQCAKIDGTMEDRLALAGFNNLAGLRDLFNKYINIVEAKDVNSTIHVPEQIDVDETVDMTEEQETIYADLRKRYRELSAIDKEDKEPAETDKIDDSIFSIMRDMDRVTTDIDMYRHRITFVIPGDESTAKNLMDTFTGEEKEVRDTEPIEGVKKPILRTVPAAPAYELGEDGHFSFSIAEEFEDEVVEAIQDLNIKLSDCAHPVMPKYAKLIENMNKEFAAGGKQIVFTEEKSQHNKILRILVHHLPITENEVGIINAEDASGEKLGKISDAYNSGKFKVIIANRKAEVGVNLQKGTTAIHHLTLPWTPSSLQQRNGRGVRQGNSVDSVHVYYYYGKGTMDSYRKKILEEKAKWLNDLFHGVEDQIEYVSSEDALRARMLFDGTDAEFEAYQAEQKAKAEAKKAKLFADDCLRNLRVYSDNNAKVKAYDEYLVRKPLYDFILETYDKEWLTYYKNLLVAPDFRDKVKALVLPFASNFVYNHQILSWVEDFEKQYLPAAKYAKKIDTIKKTCLSMKQRLEKLDTEGKLPFDVSALDHPENTIVTGSGKIFFVGGYVSVKVNSWTKNLCILEKKDGQVRVDDAERGLSGGGGKKSYKLNPNVKLQRIGTGYWMSVDMLDFCEQNEVTDALSKWDKDWGTKEVISYLDLLKTDEAVFDAVKYRDRQPSIITPFINDNLYINSNEYEIGKMRDVVFPKPHNGKFKREVLSHLAYNLRRGYTLKNARLFEFLQGLFGNTWEEEQIQQQNLVQKVEDFAQQLQKEYHLYYVYGRSAVYDLLDGDEAKFEDNREILELSDNTRQEVCQKIRDFVKELSQNS